MSRTLSILVLLAIGILPTRLLAQSSAESPPQLISYQGVLVDTDGVPLEGSRDLIFRFYHAETGGTQLGSDRVVSDVPLKDGVFSVRLDASAIEFNRQVWLETAVTDETGDNPTTLAPRTQLTAVPYAFHAFNAGESGSGWSLTGNSGTAPGTNFIGTTDHTAIEIRVHNRRALLIQPGGEDGSAAPNVIAGASTNGVGEGEVGSAVGGGEDNLASGGYATVGGGRGNNATAPSATIGGGFGNSAGGEFSNVGGGTGNTALSNFAAVAGGRDNAANNEAANVGGGWQNSANGAYATVSGGLLNTAGLDGEVGAFATVGGGQENHAVNEASTVGGGETNEARENFDTIGGGQRNVADGGGATISGGIGNSVSAPVATIAGGQANVADGEFSVVAGGTGNRAALNFSAVGGGFNNTANGTASVVGGGEQNFVRGRYAVLGGGFENNTGSAEGGGDFATTGGGKSNAAIGNLSVVSGGENNKSVGASSTVGGGTGNAADGGVATVAGGAGNGARGAYSAILGGDQNITLMEHSAIGGGQNNIASGLGAIVAGGVENVAGGHHSSVGGGHLNQAVGDTEGPENVRFAVISGGSENRAAGHAASVGGGVTNRAVTFGVVAGGEGNNADGPYASVGGGANNDVNGGRSVIGGGSDNIIEGGWATIPGGESNRADGEFSFAAGRQAHALHGGSFVWSDQSGGPFASTDVNQFLVLARGGVGIRTSSPRTQLHVTDAIDGVATVANHVVLIENNATTSSTGPDVLALKTAAMAPTGSTNFISFFDGNDNGIGAIEGTGIGVTLKSGSGDFAELLPRLDPEEEMAPSDVVGIYGGRVSKRTDGADQVLVVSSRPIVLGNAPGNGVEGDYEPVALIGQAKVRVTGAVAAGDLIVASGLEDGTGRAVPLEEYEPAIDGQVVGRAWESAPGGGEQHVNVAVGLDQAGALQALVERQQQEFDVLRGELRALRAMVEDQAADCRAPY